VRNVTRTVTEAGTTVKGLTGIDIPAMLSQAMGGATSGGDEPKPPPSRGGGGRPRPAPAPSGGPAPAWGSASAEAARPSTEAPPATVDLTTPPTQPAATPRFESQEQVDAALEGADRAIRAASRTTPRTDTAAGPARPASFDITADTTVDAAARQLATDLRKIPGIERFAAVQLDTLERSGPRPLRTMWRMARQHLDERYGQMTIGELIERYGPEGRTS
jgi:hypothetical protein